MLFSVSIPLTTMFKTVLTYMCQRPRSPDLDIESGISMEIFRERPPLPLDIPPISTNTSYARSLKWLIETSTDPDVFLAAASMVPDTDALLFLDGVSVVNIQLRDAFMSCFDEHDRCIPGAHDKAIICGLALAHMYWRRYLLPFDSSMLLPGESRYNFPDSLFFMPPEWWSFKSRWRYLESKDPNFLLVSQTGIGWRIGELHINKDLDLSQYPTPLIGPLLHTLSYSFRFAHDKERIMTLEGLAIKTLSRLLQHSSPGPSTQIVADCAFLVLCMLGLRFTKSDVINTNKR